jgi:oxygen-independent coproporphyrinogen-3 oxidase
VQRYISALEVELRQRLSSAAKPRTIHVGGGTPTALSDSELAQLLRLIDTYADMSELEEYAVEANPGTLTDNKIVVLKEHGINRISLGVQSFDNAKLQLLGRVHSAGEAKEAFLRLAAAGFDNLGLDLIYGVPGDTQSSWLADLEQATALEPKHISAYCLSVEPGTVLAGQLKRGELAQPEEQLQRELYYRAVDFLSSRSFEHYEISNFAQPGFRSLHNSATWRYEPYMGFGPAAASFDGATRRRNPADIEKYCASPMEPAETEELSRIQKAAEVMMLALRTLDGISAAQFQARCGLDLGETFGESISELESRGLLERVRDTGAVRLTHDALFVSDEVFVEFF